MYREFFKQIITTCLLATVFCCVIAPAFAQEVSDGRNMKAVPSERKLRFIKPNAVKDVVIQIEVADTPETLAKGLMERETLGKSEGILFVFPEEVLLRFWMKKTLIPLDIIFVSKDYKIIGVINKAPPCTESPCQIYSSTGNGRYAVEVNAGFAEINNIKVGDKVDF
jgi:uncharacterized membrane protein (UPF0127 family)